MITPPRSFHASRRRLGVAVVASLLAASVAVVAPASVAAAQPTPPSEPPAPAAASRVGADPASEFADGRYIVTLRDEAVATYSGGVDAYAATRAKEGS